MVYIHPDLGNNGVGTSDRPGQSAGDRHTASRAGRRRFANGVGRHGEHDVGYLFQRHGVGGGLGAVPVQHLEGERRPDGESPAVGLRHVFQFAEIVAGDQLADRGRSTGETQHTLPAVLQVSVYHGQRDDLHLAERVSRIGIGEWKVALAEGQLAAPADPLGEVRRVGSGVGQRGHRLRGYRPRLFIQIDGQDLDVVGGTGRQAGQRCGSPGFDGCKSKDIRCRNLRVAQHVAQDWRGSGGIRGSHRHQHRGGPDLREREVHGWRLPFIHVGHRDVHGYGRVDGRIGTP